MKCLCEAPYKAERYCRCNITTYFNQVLGLLLLRGPAEDAQLGWKALPALMKAPNVFVTPTAILLAQIWCSSSSFTEQTTSGTDISKLPLQLFSSSSITT